MASEMRAEAGMVLEKLRMLVMGRAAGRIDLPMGRTAAFIGRENNDMMAE